MKEEYNLSVSQSSVLKKDGNYLITGGMGGLGYIFARYIAKHTKGTLILTGRKAMNDEMENRFQELKKENRNVIYISSDVSKSEDVYALYQQIKGVCSNVNGILHAAGINQDAFFIRKDKKDFEKVLSAKVEGTRYLDEIFSEEKLDFFVMFSSIASVFGNVGQSDYGYANRYMDSYANLREQLRQQGLRSGKTVSINWPLWNQGMNVDDTSREAMEDGVMKMAMLNEAEGIQAFEDALQQSSTQFIVIKGNEQGIDQMLNIDKLVKKKEENHIQPKEDKSDSILLEKVKKFVKEIVSQHTKIPVAKIKDTERFENYGIDSITIMGLTKSLEEQIGRVAKTLFFEYENVEELSEFLITIKRTEFQKLFGMQDKKEKEHERKDELKENKTTKSKTVEYPVRKWFLDKNSTQINQNIQKETRSLGTEEDGIAIIGLSGRYPMADNIYEFWNNLLNGKDCITEIPEHRWHHEKYYDEQKGKPGKTYAKWGGFVNDIEMFDPMFFKIPPIEAEFLDPQERVLLETVWEAVEDAGYTIKTLKNEKVGVFTGVMYALYQLYETKQYGGKMNGRSSFASIANRISYLFDFKGPSIALDTMCSSALTALSLACESIKNNTSTMAVVGGVNFSLHPSKYIQLSQGGFLSTDGKCRSFGEGGDGYVPGEGSGAILIKSLKRAEEDGDHIYGVIRGIRTNAGGRTSGYTVPNLNAQRELILETLNQARINPESISTVEAHGTGTALGDPIEIDALSQAYGKFNVPKQYCSIGSLKSNIGHLEAASGIASLTKVMLEMKYKKLVPSLHSEKQNPFIAFEETPFYIQHETKDWKRLVIDGREVPRRAAISAFGAGGANAHVIVEEYQRKENKRSYEVEKECLFLLSAKNESRLKEYAKKLCNFLEMAAPKTEVPSKNENMFLESVLNVAANVLGVSPKSLDKKDLLSEIGIDKYAVERIREQLLAEYPETVLSIEKMITCKTIDDLAAQLTQTYVGLSTDNVDKKEDFEYEELPLEDIAYTLQVGREAMEQRLAIIASDKETLIASLKAYVNGEKNTQYKTGNIKDSDGKFENLLSNKGFLDYTINELRQGKLEEASEFWVMGADIPWEKLYEETKPERVSLPTYPFAKERYWIIEDDGTGCLYPDIEESISTVSVKEYGYDQEKTLHSIESGILSDNVIDNNLSSDNLEKKTIAYLKDVFSVVLKIQYEYLDELQDYEEYGIDSIYIGKLNQYLIEQFGDLPSTLFFTYKNIKQLAKYFIKEHKDKLCQMFSIEHKQEECTIRAEKKKLPEKEYTNDIAIIGISGRFPQSEGLEEYFENLRQGKDCIETIPKERWNYKDYPDIQCKWGGFIKDAEKFDPQFFNIAPIMASFMDPQERIFLEAVWSCMEDAGYTPKAMESQDEMDKRGNVAVYAGATFNEYGLYGAGEIAQGKKSSLNSQIYSIANRISYLFNFGGPSLSVDTACSSSLYAVHLACNSIITGDADMAIAGGVNLSLHPSKYITLDWGKFLASDGHCHTFGKDGDGYVPGEGTGAVLLKPLWKAQQDNDHIYAVIKGSAVNHGGKTYGYSVPNPVAQSDVIEKAIKKAGINPRTISYVEAHGTGTALGDPIEITALTDVYKKYTNDLQFCSIGSVKSNIGHLEAAAGISQLAKVVMQMKHKELVPSRLNADGLNPNIDFASTPFYVQLNNEEWKRPCIDGMEYPRRAGISAFGVGGVNVHIIVEEYEEDKEFKDTESVTEKVIIPCSAKTEQALKRYLVKFLEFIQKQENLPDLRDVSYTLIEGRIESTYRIAFVVESYEELERKITKALENATEVGIYNGKVSALEQKNIQDKIEFGNTTDVNQKAENWVNGISLVFSSLSEDYQPKKVSLPTYSYEREVYWMYSKEKQQPKEVLVEKTEEVKNQGILTQLKEAYEDERLAITISHIQSLFAEILCFTEGRIPDAEEGFFALGLESVMTRQAMMVLEEEFKVSLDEQIFFNYSNITELSGYILSHINLEAEVQEELKEIKTLYMQEKWFDAENISFTESFGRGKIAIIAANEKIKDEIKSRFQNEVLEAITFYDTSEEFAIGIEGKELPDKVVFLEDVVRKNQETSMDAFIEAYLYQKLQTMTQALQPILAQCKKNICIYYFYLNTDDVISTISSSVNGLFKSLMLEYTNVTAKTVSITEEEGYENKLVEIVSNEIKVGCIDNEIQYVLGKRQARKLYHNKILSNSKCKFKRNGVYLITGGLGGVGKIISKYLCETYQARLILCGRRALDQEIKQQIKEIESVGGKVTYIQADVTKKESVINLVKRAKKAHKKLNGVIHLAGTIKDAPFVEKTVEDMQLLSAPKILGTYYLDQALANEELDFFMMFSSISSVLGNGGQSDYCFANRYLDNFVELRNKQVKKGYRKGRSIVVNWLFWKADGMVVDAIQEKWMEKQFGLIRMEQEQGIIALENSLRAESEQVILLNGISQKIHEVLGIPEEKVEEENECKESGETVVTLDTDKSVEEVGNILSEETNSIDNLSESELIELLKQEMEIDL